MGYATVDILGQILADGSVRVGSELNTVVNTTNGIASIVVPIAVGVAVGESSVTVGGDALIQAGASAQLDAYSDTRITADTTSGLPKFSLSLSVAALDTHVTVGGNARIEAQGNVVWSPMGNVVTALTPLEDRPAPWIPNPSLAFLLPQPSLITMFLSRYWTRPASVRWLAICAWIPPPACVPAR